MYLQPCKTMLLMFTIPALRGGCTRGVLLATEVGHQYSSSAHELSIPSHAPLGYTRGVRAATLPWRGAMQHPGPGRRLHFKREPTEHSHTGCPPALPSTQLSTSAVTRSRECKNVASSSGCPCATPCTLAWDVSPPRLVHKYSTQLPAVVNHDNTAKTAAAARQPQVAVCI